MVLVIDSHPYRYEAEALCRMFLRGRELKIYEGNDIPQDDFIYTAVFGDEISVKIKMDGNELSLYDFEEDDWIYDNNYILTYGPETIIIKNGEIVKENKIEVGKEVTILKVNNKNDRVCGVIIIED